VLLGLSLGMSRRAASARADSYLALRDPEDSAAAAGHVGIGRERAYLIFTSTLTSFVQMTVSTMGGVLAVDRVVLEAGKNYGATGWRLFRYVLFPRLCRHLHGMRIGLALTLVL
jgi:ABC-type proline/glycine betaine transport system permease subunit